ncbi:MAG: ribonuclease E/G [Pseudomonadota bacterium]
MKGSLAVFGALAGRPAAARILDGQLEDLLIDPPDGQIRPGAIYRGKVGRPMKGLGGLLVETPDGPLFLRQGKGLSAGDTVIVQVTTYAELGKAAPCTARLLFKSRFAMVTPGAVGRNISKAIRDEERRVALRELLEELAVPENVGLVLRTVAQDSDNAAIAADARGMLDLAKAVLSEPLQGAPEKLVEGPGAIELAVRDWPTPDVTEDGVHVFYHTGVADMLGDIMSSRVPLPSGGFMFVEPTRALVAVDVNTGPDTSPAASLKANIEALRALPRAMRLRGYGGQVVVDLAPLSKRDRKQIESVARAAFRADPIETTLVDWTPLGHLELVRKRERLPVSDLLK